MTHSKNINNLLLRNIQNDGDKERFAAFNAIYNNPSEGATCACLLNHHPETTHSDYWMVEDHSKGRDAACCVSTSCLLPWEGQFCGIKLRIAQLEMVLTHPEYRGQGLVRLQIENFLHEVKARGYDLSIIWGIPYFYRQFGFSYAIEGDVFEMLPITAHMPGQMPSGKNDEAPGATIDPREDAVCHGDAACAVSTRDAVSTRPATMDDIPNLVPFYTRMVADLGFSIQRTLDYWQYLMLHARHPIEMVIDTQTGQTIGYVILKNPDQPGSESPILVLENFLPDTQSALAFLHHLQASYPSGSALGNVHIACPQTTPLVQAARGLGSQVARGSQWLLHITDMKNFLEKLTPVFEKRLEGSPLRGITSSLVINLYRQAYRLRFDEGKLLPVAPLGFVDASMGADGGDLCIPPEAFVRLLTGFRGLDELYDAWPDSIMKASKRPLVDILFPRFPAYLSTPFHYMGV